MLLKEIKAIKNADVDIKKVMYQDNVVWSSGLVPFKKYSLAYREGAPVIYVGHRTYEDVRITDLGSKNAFRIDPVTCTVSYDAANIEDCKYGDLLYNRPRNEVLYVKRYSISTVVDTYNAYIVDGDAAYVCRGDFIEYVYADPKDFPIVGVRGDFWYEKDSYSLSDFPILPMASQIFYSIAQTSSRSPYQGAALEVYNRLILKSLTPITKLNDSIFHMGEWNVIDKDMLPPVPVRYYHNSTDFDLMLTHKGQILGNRVEFK